jgi:acyl carrier protein
MSLNSQLGSKMFTREEVFNRVCGAMNDLFELDAKTITLETKLIEDLGLDSIDAIDLAARLEELTQRRLAEENLRSLRTVEDVVNLIVAMLSEPAEALPQRSLRETPEGS